MCVENVWERERERQREREREREREITFCVRKNYELNGKENYKFIVRGEE